jgi:hypothetical protein
MRGRVDLAIDKAERRPALDHQLLLGVPIALGARARDAWRAYGGKCLNHHALRKKSIWVSR